MPEKNEQKRRRGRPAKYVMPEPIDATPEQLAKAVLFTPPKKPQDWKFMRDFKGDTRGFEE